MGHCLIESLERVLDGSMLKQRMWAVINLFLLQSDSNFLSTLSGLVHGSL